jgi:hypothetical protein
MRRLLLSAVFAVSALSAQMLPMGSIPARGGGGGITVVTQVNGGCVGTPTTIAASFPTGHPAVGSSVIVSVGVFNPLAVTRAVTDNQTGNTYTELASPVAGGSLSGATLFAAHHVNASGTFTVTFAVNVADYLCLNLYEVSGLTGANDQHGANASSASSSSATVTATGATTAANEIIFLNASTVTSQSPSAGTIGGNPATLGQHTDGTVNTINLVDEYLIGSSPGTFTGTINFAPNALQGFSSMMGTFK